MKTAYQTTQPEFRAAIHTLWETGQLRYKLEPKQREAYDKIKAGNPEDIFVLLCHRGFGKTFLGSVLANEDARARSEESVLIVSGTLKKLRKVVKPAFEYILRDCPDEFRPVYHLQDSFYQYPGGVRVHLLAAEKGQIEDARGIHKVKTVILDETAFFGHEDDSYPLDHVVSNILLPMFIRTKSKPKIVMMTTPPTIPGHPFKTFYENAKLSGSCTEYPIYDSDVPPEKIEEIKREMLKNPGGQIAWDCEMLLKWVVDANRLIVPEWKKDYVQEVPRDAYFDFYHRYEFLDTGVRHFTLNGLAYYDFKKGKIIVEDEILLKGDEVRTDILADRTKEKENSLGYNKWEKDERGEWKNRPLGKDKLYRRIGDNNNKIILNDLSGPRIGLSWMPTTKGVLKSNTEDEEHGMVNELRVWINSGRILVHPRCKYIIGCLENGIWNKNKTQFAESATWGHFDAIAALCYLVRHVDTQTNPIPALYGLSDETHQLPSGKVESPTYKTLKEAFKITQGRKTTDRWR